MGFFGSIFGKNDRQDTSGNNGTDGWIEFVHGVDEQDWVVVDSSNAEGAIEVNASSCFMDEKDVYCVLRILTVKHKFVTYLGCSFAFGDESGIRILVDRWERQDGTVLKDDDWTKFQVLSVTEYPTITNAISKIRAYANSNKVKKEPQFVRQFSDHIIRVGYLRMVGRL